MAGIQSGDFDSPDETRTPEKTRVDAEVLGDERFVGFEFESRAAEEYARE